MADGESIIRVISKPGIKRDGTALDGDEYFDGQWVRFQRGLPRKIPGYRSINKYLDAIPRILHCYARDTLVYTHAGSNTKVERLTIDGSLNSSIITDRTPTSGYTANANNMWQFDTMFQSGGVNQIVAQVAPNLNDINNSTGGQLFYGNLTGTAVLAPITLPAGCTPDGGLVVLHPYLFAFGSDGYVAWSVPGNPADLSGAGSGAANITGQKIVAALPVRGGANAPSGLFWSADSLLRASFVGGTPIFQFDTISAQTSIMSANSVIEYDGIFYWLATDRFLMFNGVVREVDNQLNSNWFFDNLNTDYREKIFAFKDPRYGEIWWCYPRGSATEPSHAIIYNVRENIWYDTELPNGGRSAGQSMAHDVCLPLLSGVVDGGLGYKLWVHGIGTDMIDGVDVQPIQSYFETGDICLPISSGVNKSIQAIMLEPDFIQSGEMSVAIRGRANARSPEVNSTPIVFPETPSVPSEQVVHFTDGRRQLRFRFESNTIGGDYQFGHCLAHIRPSDGTTLG